ncbi:MAG TPA: helix-turn-helix transcriptional regulator [Kofleriaceae bacterium]|nr:helix-turn-helix transcriptional regulator [Kofleriaceae bacterium]
MAEPDALRVVEAGYRWVEDEREWLTGVAEAARAFAIGTGIAAYTVELGDAPAIQSYVATKVADDFETRVRAFTSSFDAATARLMYAPTEFVGNSQFRLRRIARMRKKSVAKLTRGTAVSAFALIGGDPRSKSVALVFPATSDDVDPEQPFPRARMLGLAAAHLGAATRLRQLATPSAIDGDGTESILDANGKVLHAIGDARDKAQRESLVEAVVRRERARGRLRRTDPEEAAQLWSVLVSGRWSIIDFVDRDGKRLMLARRNPVNGPDVLALDEQERDVVWLATLGHSRKYIAYELGLATATVTKRLGNALKKLRIRNRRELLRKLGRAA